MAERLPPGAYDAEKMIPAYLPNGLEYNGVHHPDANGELPSRTISMSSSILDSSTGIDSAVSSRIHGLNSFQDASAASSTDTRQHNQLASFVGADGHPEVRLPNGEDGHPENNANRTSTVDGRDPSVPQDGESSGTSRNSALPGISNQVEAEWIEQYEPGVYITLVALRDGTRDLKRVRFRYSETSPYPVLKY